MNNEILTPVTLWADFDDSLPLKESVVNVVSLGVVDYNYIYFSGRQTPSSRVRIYALYAKQKAKSKGSMLILPNVSGVIDEDLVHHYVKIGYDVLFVDLAGEREGEKNYTKYPPEVSYANFTESQSSFYNANKSVKETCWYEWVSVARYAVSFLEKNNPNKPIFAMGIKHGANVLWQLAGTDKRISASVFLFGAGWLSYKDIDKRSDVDINVDDERIRYIAGVDAQSYAQYVTCPVLFLGTTNSKEFNAERAVDTLSYLENQKKTYFNFSVSSVDVLDGNYLTIIDTFLSKYVLKTKIKLPEYPILEIDVKNDEIEYDLSYSTVSDVKSICVYTSVDNAELSKRVWYKKFLTPNESGKINFTEKLFSSTEGVLTFVKIKYKNGFAVSSKIVYKKVSFTSTVKQPKVLFNTNKYFIEFIVDDIKSDLIGEVFTENNLFNITAGPNDIKGVTSFNSLSTYAIKNFANDINDSSFLKFDVYTSSYLNLTLILTCNDVEYSYTVSLSGGEVWQNVIIDFAEFKDANGIDIEDYTKISYLTFKAIGKYTLNNVMVL